MHKKTSAFLNQRASENGKFQCINSVLLIAIGGLVYIVVGIKAWSGSISAGNMMQLIGNINQFVNGVTQVTATIEALQANKNFLCMTYDFLDCSFVEKTAVLPVPKKWKQESYI